jgi:hypothetical protein
MFIELTCLQLKDILGFGNVVNHDPSTVELPQNGVENSNVLVYLRLQHLLEAILQ